MTTRQTVYETVPTDSLTPHPENYRRANIPGIRASLRAHGQYRPLVAQRTTRHILAGNNTWLAAREEGLADIDVRWVDVPDDEAREILAVDNKTSDDATNDDRALAELLARLDGDHDALARAGYTIDEYTELARMTGLLEEDSGTFLDGYLADTEPDTGPLEHPEDQDRHFVTVSWPVTADARDRILRGLRAVQDRHPDEISTLSDALAWACIRLQNGDPPDG
jgi:hypothetical protein